MTTLQDAAKGDGGRRFYVVSAEATEKAGARHAVLGLHLAWLAEIEASGHLFLAGPFVGEDGKSEGGGLFILRADSLAEAKALAARDPYNSEGYRRATVRPWRLDQGAFKLKVSLTSGGHGFA
jgi:uncharacterized protein YciI